MIIVENSLNVWHCNPLFGGIKSFRILFVAAALRATATAESITNEDRPRNYIP